MYREAIIFYVRNTSAFFVEGLKELRQTCIRIVGVPVKFRYGHLSPGFLTIQYLRLTALT